MSHDGAVGSRRVLAVRSTRFASGIVSRLLNQFLFDVPDLIESNSKIVIDAAAVKEKLSGLIKNKDLSEFIL